MNSLERWLAVINHERPDRVPTDFWSTEEVLARLLKDLKCSQEDDLWRKLKIDKLHVIEAKYIGPAKPDLWNLEYQEVSYANEAGIYKEVASHPLAFAQTVDDLSQFVWPSPDWFDYSRLRQEAVALHQAGWPVRCGSFEPFLLYCQLRGMEQSFMDLILNPELTHEILKRIFNFHYTYIKRQLESAGKGNVEICYVAEDLGTQTGLLMSEDLIDQFLKPNMKKVIELTHTHGARAFHHSDGAVRPLLHGMIAIGIDFLNPIQWRCPGMERQQLKDDFGEKIIFHGAVDNQFTLPYGTMDDVIAEVKENIDVLGKKGGYILAPCHNIQPITSTEKIVAMYQTAHTYGVY